MSGYAARFGKEDMASRKRLPQGDIRWPTLNKISRATKFTSPSGIKESPIVSKSSKVRCAIEDLKYAEEIE